VQVTLCVQPGVPDLRDPRIERVLAWAVSEAHARAEPGEFQVVHAAVQARHLHLLTLPLGTDELAYAMQYLGARLAPRINAVVGRRCKLFADRYVCKVLKTRRAIDRAVAHLATLEATQLPTRSADLWSCPANPLLDPSAAALQASLRAYGLW